MRTRRLLLVGALPRGVAALNLRDRADVAQLADSVVAVVVGDLVSVGHRARGFPEQRRSDTVCLRCGEDPLPERFGQDLASRSFLVGFWQAVDLEVLLDLGLAERAGEFRRVGMVGQFQSHCRCSALLLRPGTIERQQSMTRYRSACANAVRSEAATTLESTGSICCWSIPEFVTRVGSRMLVKLLRIAQSAHAGGGRVRFYELAWSFNSRQGASHCLDFLLVFGTLSPTEVAAHPHAHPNAASEFTHVADKMRTDWATFAASGDPGWAPNNPRTRTTRVYGTTATDRPYLQEPSRPIWATHRFDALELLA